MILRRSFLAQSLLFLAGCASVGLVQNQPNRKIGRLTIGIVAYGEEAQSVERYQRFTKYLETELKTLTELEPAYNEVKAVEQIQRHTWSLVFAPPGLAAIAVSDAEYLPVFRLQGVDNLRSVLVVLNDSPIEQLIDVNGKVVALGQPGSATGYYVPLYDLYGTTPAEIRIAPTPRTGLEWLAQGEVAVAALSKDEFDRHRTELSPASFRILHTSRRLPAGAVLLNPKMEPEQQQLIQQAMNDAIPSLAQEVGYIPNAKAPDYSTLISFIKKVKPIEVRIYDQPAPLYATEAPASP